MNLESDDVVEVYQTEGRPEAEVIRAMLESNGIETILGPNRVSADRALRFKVGPTAAISIYVRRAHIETASRLIASPRDEADDGGWNR